MIEVLNPLAQSWWGWMSAVLLQSSLLIAILVVFDRIFRRWLWPQLRLALWMLVFLKLVLPPDFSSPTSLSAPVLPDLNWTEFRDVASPNLAPFTLKNENAAETPSKRPSPRAEPEGSILLQYSPDQASTRPGWISPPIHWTLWLLLIWSMGSLGLTGLILARWLNLRRRLLATSRPACKRIHAALDWAVGRANLKRLPRVCSSAAVASPAVFGIYRPFLILPGRGMDSLGSTDLRHILLHEVVHLKRRDLLIQKLALVFQIIFWLHPLLWLARRRIQQLQELCCDAHVVSLLERSQSYQKTLLLAARKFLVSESPQSLSQLGLIEGSSQLRERLRWVRSPGGKRRKWRLVIGAGAVLFMLTSILPMAHSRLSSGETGFSLISIRTYTPVGQGKTYYGDFVLRFSRADGQRRAFRLVRPSGQSSYLTALKGYPWIEDCESLRQSLDFLREERVLGYRALVIGQSSGGSYIEHFYAPELKCELIKLVVVSSEALSVVEPLSVEVGTPPAEAFGPQPDIQSPDYMAQQRRRGQALYPQVAAQLQVLSEKVTSHPRIHDFQRQQGTIAELAIDSMGKQLAVRPVDYPFRPHLPPRFGPGETLFFVSKGPSEIHGCALDGSIQLNYFLGTRDQFLDAHLFTLDRQGRVHALLGAKGLAGDFRWFLRRFHSPEEFEDVSLSLPYGSDPVDMAVDHLENYYLLWRSRDQLVVHKIDSAGLLLERMTLPAEELPLEYPMGLVRLRHSGSSLGVLPSGEVFLFVRFWTRESNVALLSGALYRLNLGAKGAVPIQLTRPTPWSRLTGLHKDSEALILEWTDYETGFQQSQASMSETSAGISPFEQPRHLEIFDGSSRRILATVQGSISTASVEKMLVQSPRHQDGPSLYLVDTETSTSQ